MLILSEEARRVQMRLDCNKPGYKLPYGAAYAYIVVAAGDHTYRMLAMSFDSEQLISLATNELECRRMNWGERPRVMRISVLQIEGLWHKINIRPISSRTLLPDTGTTAMTAINFAPNPLRINGNLSNKVACLLKPWLVEGDGSDRKRGSA